MRLVGGSRRRPACLLTLLVLLALLSPMATAFAPGGTIPFDSESAAQYVIFGEVFDGKSGQPIDGAVIVVSEQGVEANRTVSAPTGYFSMGVPNGTYRIEISKNGYELWFFTAVTIAGASKSLGRIGLDPKSAGGPPASGDTAGFSAPFTVFVILSALVFALAGLLLFSRISKSQVLNNQRRKQIFEYVQANPGIHFRKMMQELQVGSGVLSHHMHTLEREGLVTSKRHAGKRLFFPLGVSMEGMQVKDVKEQIVDEVRHTPGITQAEVATKLNISRMLAHYHVRSLVEEKRLRVEHENNGRVSMYTDATGGWYKFGTQ